ncbi:MAG: hypothetical protein U0350_40015 [Caldilineaceae bacterium]
MYWHAGQLGADLSSSVFFDMSLDNVRQINLNGDRLREKTVAIVGGQGDGAARTFVVRTGANQAVTNDYEIFVDARSNKDSELSALGDARMGELRARTNLNAEIFESIGYRYKRDYNHGDLVTVNFAGTSARKKIDGVEVKFDQDQNSNVKLELIDW